MLPNSRELLEFELEAYSAYWRGATTPETVESGEFAGVGTEDFRELDAAVIGASRKKTRIIALPAKRILFIV